MYIDVKIVELYVSPPWPRSSRGSDRSQFPNKYIKYEILVNTILKASHFLLTMARNWFVIQNKACNEYFGFIC